MSTPMLSARARRDPGVTLWAVAGACWILTFALALGGGDGLGHHDVVLERSRLPWTLRIAGFVAAWQVMVGAMMLPTVVPLARLFTAVGGRQPRPAAARAAFYAAYLTVWTGFALVALAGDGLVHGLVERWDWLAARPGLLMGTTLTLAGAFQFSDLKARCLNNCRDPVAFLWQYYRRGPAGAWWLGFRHGLDCLGCCWALMLVMFGTGVGSLVWMLVLTAVMVVEKTAWWGRRLVVPVGVALLAAGLATAVPALLGSVGGGA